MNNIDLFWLTLLFCGAVFAILAVLLWLVGEFISRVIGWTSK